MMKTIAKPLCLMLATTLAPLIGLTSCGPKNYGAQSRVATVDSGTASRVNTRLTGADMKRFAEGITDKMLASRQAVAWGEQRPRLIVGTPVNNTDDENLAAADVYDGIQERLFNADLVRVMDPNGAAFDYIVESEISSTRQRDQASDQELVFYTLKLKLYSDEGELVGQWSDDAAFAQRSKSWL